MYNIRNLRFAREIFRAAGGSFATPDREVQVHEKAALQEVVEIDFPFFRINNIQILCFI
jgi:hypothetical protein